MRYEVPRRDEIKVGQKVWGLEKVNYKNGVLTSGIVERILTNKQVHSRGIKVMLTGGTVVRVQHITEPKY